MTSSGSDQSVSRRAALAGLGAGGLGLALAATPRLVAAQGIDMATHPMVGTWLAGRAANGLGTAHIGPDGSFTNNGDMISQTPGGALALNSLDQGVWEPISARGIHFTFTATNYDAAGTPLGTSTVDGYPVASEDGQSFWDDGTQVTVTLRDATGAVTKVLGPGLEGAGIGGVRMAPGKPGYAEMLAMLAARKTGTPTP